MNIYIIGNCQTGQLIDGLQAILSPTVRVQGHAVDTALWNAQANQTVVETARAADLLLTHLSASHFTQWVAPEKIIQIPDLFFGGFHPDHFGLQLKSRPGKLLKFSAQTSENRPGHFWIRSALATWAYMKRLSLADTAKLFRADVFQAMGYFDAFALHYAAMKENFAALGFDFTPMTRVLHSRDVFMWGTEHPKLTLTLGLCEAIAKRLNLPHRDPAVGLTLMDCLEREFACGCYPPIAEYLGVPGSWSIRMLEVFHPDLPSYLAEYFWFMGRIPTSEIQVLDRYTTTFRFEEMDAVLENYL